MRPLDILLAAALALPTAVPPPAAVAPEGMARVPGGTFGMGTDAAGIPDLQRRFGVKRAALFADEAPRHAVTLDAFFVDAREVTNAQFRAFVEQRPEWRPDRIPARLHNGNYLRHWAGGRPPEGAGDLPVVNVSWYAAAAYCRCAGKRLPTEAEWEYAARGGLRDRAFPWGDEPPDPSRANFLASGLGRASAVGRYAPNGYGLHDMAGNVWEYVLDEWGPYPAEPQTNPVAGGSLVHDRDVERVATRRVIRGGSWGGAPVNLRVAFRDSHPPGGAGDHVGFRCAKPAPGR